MKIRCFLTTIIVGLMLLSMPRAAANEVLSHVEFTELSPALRDLVAKEFPKDPLLREYLDHDNDDDGCRDPLEKFSGATVPLNTKGDLGAFIYILGCGWGGTAGSDFLIFLKKRERWKLVGSTLKSFGPVDVLRRTDHGFYRLDLGLERDCEARGHAIDTDGIMVWKGKTYDRLNPCPVYKSFRLDSPLALTLRRLVMSDFPRDPQLKEYLVPSEFEQSADHLPKLWGAIFQTNTKGELGAAIVVDSDVWCKPSGCPLHIFLKRGGKWSRTGEIRIWRGSGYVVEVQQKSDHGFYRLDYYRFDLNLGPYLCPDPYCGDEHGDEGTMIWTGKRYERFQPGSDR